ncbi:MAG: hypothetical protein AVDCRST_MAG37-1531 [uncultured Rubrobacteraceae bacterium]|uniref:Uncharacterized protein n=1 Tax=uncultured Rubrobacteraceae bacterium TaxID=349277 RepID=A0A6J4QER5_9ACTN|nr:MAG: hypothetical protein AVDCRST_MAG37-1531 [uncultured Rubrobacteraceae bacterium]
MDNGTFYRMEEFLSSGEVAKILEERGVMSTRTFPSYVSIRAWDLGRIPEPDAVIGRRFYGWRRSTIERWLWERGELSGEPEERAPA